MGDKTDLTFEEEQWLEVFSKDNPFFRSLNYFYGDYGYLTENQYYYFEKEIDKTECNGDKVLSKKETRIFRELAEGEAEVRKLLKHYTVDGYFNESNYEHFIQLINKCLPENEKIEIFRHQDAEKLKKLLPHEQKVVRIPCSHCSFLCSSQLRFCKKCGEPLPKMNLYISLKLSFILL